MNWKNSATSKYGDSKFIIHNTVEAAVGVDECCFHFDAPRQGRKKKKRTEPNRSKFVVGQDTRHGRIHFRPSCDLRDINSALFPSILNCNTTLSVGVHVFTTVEVFNTGKFDI